MILITTAINTEKQLAHQTSDAAATLMSFEIEKECQTNSAAPQTNRQSAILKFGHVY